MRIREAVPEDNVHLQELQARCPQGASLVVSTVYTPDFFARARAYESHKVFVACEGDRIVGSIACALRNGVLNGAPARVGYGFGAFVSPERRRAGIASRLHQAREDYLAREGAVLLYSLVMEGNRPSMRLLEGRGFDLHRTLVMPGLAVYRRMEVSARGTIRPAREDDLVPIARLLNETWHAFQLYEPTSAEGLARFIDRTPAYGLDSLLMLESRGDILACLGFWDWSRLARITLLGLSPRVRMIGLLLDVARRFRPMPRALRVGDTLRQMVLTPIGFRDPLHLAPLVRLVNNLALEREIEQLFCICERDHPLLRATKGFIRVDTSVHVYVKPLREKVLVADGPLFVDGIDL